MVIAACTNARCIRVADQGKDMTTGRRRESVGIGDGLHAHCGESEDQIEVVAGHFFGDGVACTNVALGVVGAESHAAAIRIAAVLQDGQCTCHAIVERGNRNLLHHRNPHCTALARRFHAPGIEIGVEQYRRGSQDQKQAEGNLLQNCRHAETQLGRRGTLNS